jgi:diguanylate cyclase (GGDEF)-like protein
MLAGASTRLLLVEPDPRAALWVGEMLRASWPLPLVIAHAERLPDALDDLALGHATCILLATTGPADAWLGEVEQLRSAAAEVPILIIGDEADHESALRALRAGAQDYLHRAELCPSLLRRSLAHAIERKATEVQLTYRALHDALTGLPNRALFLDRLGVALDRARRSGARVAVLFLDVDNFKEINDSRGHAAGDALLIELGERLRTMLRPMDTVARFGGDEFTFLFEELADEREVVLISERIARACKLPIDLEHGGVAITVSMGIAMVSDPRTEAETVIREADAAMYRAKERGGGRFELYDESTRDRALERIELEAELRRAVEEGQLRVYYQPRYSLAAAGVVIGLEALVRWEHPERGLIGAEEFIALAEQTGLVLELGRYVLDEALRRLPGWREQRPGVTLAVNLCQRELEDIGFPAHLASHLRRAGVEPDALCLEVPESAVSRNPALATRALRALQDIGVRTTLDDFGTGSFSVLELRRLPVDEIKIHESLLAELGSDEQPVVGAVVDLAHALGLRVVAEGVETEDQAERLRALGCDGAQGFLFARPMPEEDVEPLLDRADGDQLECPTLS